MVSIPKAKEVYAEFKTLNDMQKVYIMGAIAALTINKEIQLSEPEKSDKEQSAS